MPVSAVNPSRTVWGTYSDHAKRFSSSAAAARAGAAASSATRAIRGIAVSMGSTRTGPAKLADLRREDSGGQRDDDEQRRERVEHRIQADPGERVKFLGGG